MICKSSTSEMSAMDLEAYSQGSEERLIKEDFHDPGCMGVGLIQYLEDCEDLYTPSCFQGFVGYPNESPLSRAPTIAQPNIEAHLGTSQKDASLYRPL